MTIRKDHNSIFKKCIEIKEYKMPIVWLINNYLWHEVHEIYDNYYCDNNSINNNTNWQKINLLNMNDNYC